MALPLVGGLAFGLIGGHPHGDAAHLLDLFDLHVAIAEGQDVTAAHSGQSQNLLHQQALGKGFRVIQRAVDAAIEVARDVQQAGLFLHVRLVGAAGQVQLESAGLQGFQQGAGAGHQVLVGRAVAAAEFAQATGDHRVQAVQVPALVDQGIQRRAAAALHLFRQRDHLVDGLPAGEAPDEIFDHRAQLVFGFAGMEFGQNLHHHRHHHLHPAGADEGEGAIEIEECDLGICG